ncbi:calcium-binding protein [Streptomyces populi]
MKTRAVVGVLSGALALATLAVPGADAVTKYTDVKNIVVNDGKPVVLGVSGSVSVPVSMAASVATHGVDATLYHGDWPVSTDATVDPVKSCAGRTGDYTCTMTFTFTALKSVKKNAQAGTWGVAAYASGNADAQKFLPYAFNVVRAAKLTTDASPEPAKYGGTITVTGRLTRANWETGQYAGNINQQVQLQFRDKNAGAYTTVRTVTSGTDGALRATVPALAEGSWRWVFAGTGTTGAATSTADYVVVK